MTVRPALRAVRLAEAGCFAYHYWERLIASATLAASRPAAEAFVGYRVNENVERFRSRIEETLWRLSVWTTSALW
jgi:hypothetical protein